MDMGACTDLGVATPPLLLWLLELLNMLNQQK